MRYEPCCEKLQERERERERTFTVLALLIIILITIEPTDVDSCYNITDVTNVMATVT